MKVMFGSKKVFGEHPLALLDGWIVVPRNHFMALSTYPFIEAFGEEGAMDLVIRNLKGYTPDMFVITGSGAELIAPEHWARLKEIKSKTVFWTLDDPAKLLAVPDRQKKITSHFDYVVTCHRCESTYDFYKQAGVKDVIFGVPVAANFLLESSVPPTAEQVPDNKKVVLYGTALYERDIHIKQCVLGRTLLVKEIIKDKIVNAVDVYGRKSFIEQMKKAAPDSMTHGIIHYNELNRLSGSIILNPHGAAPGDDYLNARFFEACAVGCPQITEYKDCVIEMLDLIEGCDQERADFEKCLYAVGDMSAFKQALSHAYNLPKDRYASLCQYVQRLARLWTGKEFMEKVMRGIEAGDGSEYFGPMIRKGN